MNHEILENFIADLIERSLKDKHLKEEITFPIPLKTIDKAWKNHFIDLREYTCKIHSDEIRHIYKEHQEDVYLISKILYYLETCMKIEKSSTRDRQTGKDLPCLVFTKHSSTTKIKIVKVHLSRNKILSLKTLYEVS